MPNQIAVGTVMPFAGDPGNQATYNALQTAGWLPCWGQSVPVATYPDLDGVIGNLYGGDGQTDISLPDLRGVFLRGAGSGLLTAAALVSQTAPPVSGSFTLDSAGAHTHNAPNVPGWDNHSDRCAGHTNANWNGGSGTSQNNSANHSHTISGGGDSESRPINCYVHYIIKVLSV